MTLQDGFKILLENSYNIDLAYDRMAITIWFVATTIIVFLLFNKD